MAGWRKAVRLSDIDSDLDMLASGSPNVFINLKSARKIIRYRYRN